MWASKSVRKPFSIFLALVASVFTNAVTALRVLVSFASISVLEYVSTNGTDKWEAPVYENGLIVGNTKDGNVVNTAQNIGTITFKVKKPDEDKAVELKLNK